MRRLTRVQWITRPLRMSLENLKADRPAETRKQRKMRYGWAVLSSEPPSLSTCFSDPVHVQEVDLNGCPAFDANMSTSSERTGATPKGRQSGASRAEIHHGNDRFVVPSFCMQSSNVDAQINCEGRVPSHCNRYTSRSGQGPADSKKAILVCLFPGTVDHVMPY